MHFPCNLNLEGKGMSRPPRAGKSSGGTSDRLTWSFPSILSPRVPTKPSPTEATGTSHRTLAYKQQGSTGVTPSIQAQKFFYSTEDLVIFLCCSFFTLYQEVLDSKSWDMKVTSSCEVKAHL